MGHVGFAWVVVKSKNTWLWALLIMWVAGQDLTVVLIEVKYIKQLFNEVEYGYRDLSRPRFVIHLSLRYILYKNNTNWGVDKSQYIEYNIYHSNSIFVWYFKIPISYENRIKKKKVEVLIYTYWTVQTSSFLDQENA